MAGEDGGVRSSSGEYYLGLDHLRALAAFLVFAWHFTHASGGVPMDGVPLIPLFALTDEGHFGVALFMTLTGYLFAKLLDGRQINYLPFFWNRAVRLLPLLVAVLSAIVIIDVVTGGDWYARLEHIAVGIIRPTLPNGGWSLTVELHFYVLLPALLFLSARWKHALLAALVLSIAIRTFGISRTGDYRDVVYSTIIGRADQFLLGMIAWQYRGLIVGRHAAAAVVAIAFVLFFWWYDAAGGHYGFPNQDIWIVMPTIEGAALGCLVAYYDGTFKFQGRSWFSRALAAIGRWSYSIYLLHPFFFGAMHQAMGSVIALDNIYVATAGAVVAFLAMTPLAALSYQLIEKPFLRLRRPYLMGSAPHAAPASAAQPSAQ